MIELSRKEFVFSDWHRPGCAAGVIVSFTERGNCSPVTLFHSCVEDLPLLVGYSVSVGRENGGKVYTVLLVEDNRETGRLMRFLFELEGYRVVTADTYEDILTLLQETLPDVVLMDVNVQGKETIDLIQRVRMLEGQVANTLLVMTSATDCHLECMRAGADRFIPKPCLPDKVVEEIAGLCKQRRAGNLPRNPCGDVDIDLNHLPQIGAKVVVDKA
jgi:CheY-like chemotaxis protein